MFTASQAKDMASLSKPSNLTRILERVKELSGEGDFKTTMSVNLVNQKDAKDLKELGYEVILIEDSRDVDFYNISWK